MIGASSSNSSVSPCTVRDTTSRDFFASPRSSYSPNTSQTQSSASRSRWFSNFLPVQGNEDHSADMNDLALLQELEQAEEVTEKSNLDAAAEDREMPLAFNSARHLSAYEEDPEAGKTNSWRIRERMKTVSVALVCCLNVGVDPPDVTKTQPCARLECWVDPTVLNPQKAIEAIGNNLQKQYERWQPKARYRQSLDPPLEEVRRLATSLRRNARDERVLFHYNGHGVPKPTANGEIWVFNRNYTQYIPLSLYDLQSWMGSPSIFVYDCSNAGIIVHAFEQFADQHEREYLEQVNSRGVSSADLPAPITQRNCIQLAACSSTEILPMNPDLPADLFTCCLTTPIKMALRYFVMQGHGKLAPGITVEMLDKIPGQFGDRRTMLGELNWIFTAITDTIAWNTLQRDLFQKLFRQDLLVASLFRNFLLAERVMRSYDCTPISQPSLPSTQQHNMWKAWDLAVDIALAQLPGILEKGNAYKASSFFEEQLTAFEVWLKFGDENRSPPEQLPIVLQVLLSQAHRLRALDLLGQFLDIGPWAVNLALSVGIFPYVLKLLQSSARELRPLLVSIWAKILSVDQSCQTDLIRENSHKYFLSVLQDEAMKPEHRTWAAFIMATLVNKFPQGQQEAEQGNLIAICLDRLSDPRPIFRQWLAIALGRVWDKYDTARWRGTRDNAHEKLFENLKDPVPEVRAAVVYALGTFLNACEERNEHANNVDHAVALQLLTVVAEDSSPIVRRELVIALSYVVQTFESAFINVCKAVMDEEEQYRMPQASANSATWTRGTVSGQRLAPSISSSAIDRISASQISLPRNSSAGFLVTSSPISMSGFYARIWVGLNQLKQDPDEQVQSFAKAILDYLRAKSMSRGEKTRSLSMETSSVPSSPSKPSFMLGSSPPASSVSGLGHRRGPISAIQEEDQRPTSHDPTPGPSSSTTPKRGSTPVSSRLTTTATENNTTLKELKTNFIPWSYQYFTKQLMGHEGMEDDCDYESPRHWNKEWLYQRNLEVRNEAEVQRDLLRTRLCKLDDPVTSFRTSFSPNLVTFHPYNNQLAVAGQKHIVVQNLDTLSTLCSMTMKTYSDSHQKAQFTALNYVNAHEHALILAGSDDGVLRIYKDTENLNRYSTSDVELLTSWTALKEHTSMGQRKHQRSFGIKVSWEQKTRLIAVGGDSKTIRLWDASTELKLIDLPTNADTGGAVTCLDFSNLHPDLLIAGFADGFVRIFDVRVNDGCVSSFRDHVKPVLDATMQDSGGFSGHVVSGSMDGDVKIMDPRAATKGAVKQLTFGQPVQSLSIHRRAFAVAAWLANQNSVSIHTLLGNAAQLNTIRIVTEGSGSLLGRRGGMAAGSVVFHPHLLQLATSPSDRHVGVYNLRSTV